MYILGLSLAFGLHALTDYHRDAHTVVWYGEVQRGCLLGIAHSHAAVGIRSHNIGRDNCQMSAKVQDVVRLHS